MSNPDVKFRLLGCFVWMSFGGLFRYLSRGAEKGTLDGPKSLEFLPQLLGCESLDFVGGEGTIGSITLSQVRL